MLPPTAISCRAYGPDLEAAWLDLLAEVQARSNAWEAAYTARPAFDPGCDLCFLDGGRLAAVLAGRREQDAAGRARWNIEVLAVHPDLQGRGLGHHVLAVARARLGPAAEVVFWTRDPAASAFYARAGLRPRGRARLERGPWGADGGGLAEPWTMVPDPAGPLVEWVMEPAAP